MQPLQYDLQSSAATDNSITHAAAAASNLNAATPMRSTTGDSKTPFTYAHITIPKAASSHRYTAAKKKRQTDRSHNRRTHEVPFIVACSHFTRKNTRFRAPASSPKHSPCNIMQPFQWDLQPQIPKHPITTHTQPHPKQLQATVTLRQTKKNTPEQQITRVMQPFQWDLQPQIPKHPIPTHTQPHPKQLQTTVTLRQKKTTNRPQPQPSHTRGTFHRRLQPLYTEKHKVSCSGFLPKT